MTGLSVAAAIAAADAGPVLTGRSSRSAASARCGSPTTGCTPR